MLSRDEAVRAAITAVFNRFDEPGSARQVVLWLRADGLRLPRRSAGARVIRRAEATYPAGHDFLTNPAYGGACVFVRTKVSRHLDEAGRIVVRDQELSREQWEVTIPDHHPSYVSRQTYVATGIGCAPTCVRPKGRAAGRCVRPAPSCRGWWCAASAGGGCWLATPAQMAGFRGICARRGCDCMARRAAVRV